MGFWLSRKQGAGYIRGVYGCWMGNDDKEKRDKSGIKTINRFLFLGWEEPEEFEKFLIGSFLFKNTRHRLK